MAQEPVIKIMKTASNNTLIFRCRGVFKYSSQIDKRGFGLTQRLQLKLVLDCEECFLKRNLENQNNLYQTKLYLLW